MVTISLCMIVRDEEAVLARCLDSVRDAADEIIIVDTGSQDATKDIARRYTDRVYDFEWVDDFSRARNFAFGLAVMDYRLWLDADDALPGPELHKLLALKETLSPDIDMVTMKYHTHFDEQGRPTLTSTRERLIRREGNFRWIDPVHECIPLAGRILHSDIAVWHLKPRTERALTRNLDIYEALEGSGAALSPRQQYYFARELRDHGRFEKAAQYFRRFLDGGLGWTEDNIAACTALGLCLRALGRTAESLAALAESFRHGPPRAEACCEFGYHYKLEGDFKNALAWFDVAAALPRPDSIGFVDERYSGYVPAIEACVCCYQLGDTERAKAYNRRAGEFRPGDPAVLSNERFFGE